MAPPRVQPDPAPARRSPARAATASAPLSGSTEPDVPIDGAMDGDADAVGVPASKRVLRSQGRRTMRKLLDAAMIAFEERGYYETRVNDVVKIAKTSHGTFYLYFSNKEDVLRALVSEAGIDARNLADVLNRPPALGGTPQWADVRLWVTTYSDLWVRYGALFRAWTDLARIDPELTEVLRQTWAMMAEALAGHIAPDAIDPHVAAMAALAMLDRFHSVREFAGQPVDEAALDTVATMIYRSLFEENPSRSSAVRQEG